MVHLLGRSVGVLSQWGQMVERKLPGPGGQFPEKARRFTLVLYLSFHYSEVKEQTKKPD